MNKKRHFPAKTVAAGIVLCAALVLVLFAAKGQETPSPLPDPGAEPAAELQAAAAATDEGADAAVNWNDRYELGLSFIRKGEDDKALEIFTQCSTQAEAPQVRALSSLWEAHIYESQDKPNKAILVYINLIDTSDIRVYRVYANMNLYFLKQRFSSRSFNFQWVPTRMLGRFFLLRASSSPSSFKFYIFNLAPMMMTMSRLAMFTAFWFLCLFLSRLEAVQNTKFLHEAPGTSWSFKDILWLYVLFIMAETIVFLPYHGSNFYMNNIERGIYIESILRMVMLAMMSLFFFAVKQVRIAGVFAGTGTMKEYRGLLLKYSGYILIVIGLIGFACRYELLGFERARRVYEFSITELLTGTGLYKTLLVLFMAPLAEELFYRGVILGALRKFFRPGVAIVLSSLIFAAVHLNPVTFPVIFLMALILGRAYTVTGGIFVPVIIHFIYNLFSLLDVVRFL